MPSCHFRQRGRVKPRERTPLSLRSASLLKTSPSAQQLSFSHRESSSVRFRMDSKWIPNGFQLEIPIRNLSEFPNARVHQIHLKCISLSSTVTTCKLLFFFDFFFIFEEIHRRYIK